MARRSASPATATNVHIFKVSLNPRLWRRIALRGDQSLDDLHQAIFAAFDRDDEHLYEFKFPALDARARPRARGGRSFLHPMAAESLDDDATAVTLDQLQLRPGRSFAYIFDFGDEWRHKVEVEATDAEDPGCGFPAMVESRGKSPPQYPDAEE